MTTDRLSAVLDLIEVRSIISGSTAVSGRWKTESSLDEELKFFAVVQGRMRLSTDGSGGVIPAMVAELLRPRLASMLMTVE